MVEEYEILNEQYAAALETREPCVRFRPRIFLDGNKWCVLYGDNLQDGVAGFGDSPDLAMLDFNAAWSRKLVVVPQAATGTITDKKCFDRALSEKEVVEMVRTQPQAATPAEQTPISKRWIVEREDGVTYLRDTTGDLGRQIFSNTDNARFQRDRLNASETGEIDNHHNAAKCPYCTENGKFVMVEAAELERLRAIQSAPTVAAATPAEATGTMECPICRTASPHSHELDEIENWSTNLVARWGYRAYLVHQNQTLHPVEKESRETLEYLKGEREGWNKYPRGFSTESFHETPLLDEALKLIDTLLSDNVRLRRGQSESAPTPAAELGEKK